MPRKRSPSPTWQVIIEEIRSQNRATIEAVESSRAALQQQIEVNDRESRARDALLERAIRQNSADIRQNSADIRQNSADIQALMAKVDGLTGLEARVTAIEKRLG